jgi:uncharacterized protein
MRDVLRVLVDLQETDEDLFRIRRELARLPEERDQRRAEIDARIQRVKELDSEILRLSMQEKEVEDVARSNRQRIMKIETESGKTHDQALLAAYSHEQRNLRREISEIDRNQLREGIATDEKDYAEYAANVEAEIAAASAKEAAKVKAREERMGNSVPADVRDTYEKLLEARDGMALAALEEKTCQGCYIQVPTNIYVRLMRSKDLVQCPNCQRILFMWD